jgi:hypothetical protein
VNIPEATIQHIKNLGYRVFVPVDRTIGHRTYLYYASADGKRIGYYQPGIGVYSRICTVHKPCAEHGTGFIIGSTRSPDVPTKEELEAGHCFAPPWASRLESVKKYKDIEEFIQSRYCPVEEV